MSFRAKARFFDQKRDLLAEQFQKTHFLQGVWGAATPQDYWGGLGGRQPPRKAGGSGEAAAPPG